MPIDGPDDLLVARRAADPLLACLAFIARHRGLAFSHAGVLDHIPLGDDGRLTIAQLPRAAARLGLKSRLVRKRPSHVPALVVPFIVLFGNGDAGVVVGRHGRRNLSIVMPAVSDAIDIVPARRLDAIASGAVVYLALDGQERVGRDAGAPQNGPPASRRWFWTELARYWPVWLQIVLAALVINCLGLAFPLFVMSVYDRVIPNLAIPTLWALLAGVVIAVAFDLFLRQLRTIALDDVGRRIDLRLTSQIFAHALSLPAWAHRDQSGALANAIRDFEGVRDFFTSSSIVALCDLLFIGIFIVVLWIIVGPLALVPLAAVPLALLTTAIVQVPIGRAARRTQAEAAHRHGLLVESLGGVETIKSVGAEAVIQRRWETAVTAAARGGAATRLWSALATYLTSGIQQAVGIVMLVWGVFLVADGRITVGALIAANLLGGRVMAPLASIAVTIVRAQQAFAALSALSRLMGQPSERPHRVASAAQVRHGAIAFNGVSFAYPGNPVDALREATFEIAPGERVGIVGRVGSGKTTIGRLVAGLSEADRGIVLIDGAQIQHYDPAELRAGVGFLPQEPELFTGTLRENLIMGAPQATEPEIEDAIKVAGVDAFSRLHPLGLSLPVGERGRRLSGGQRQAAAIARLLIRRPRILFLDEPTGAMDANTEQELIGRLRASLVDGQTLLICSHRVALFELVERLIVVDHGRIVADGPRRDILARLGTTGSRPRAGAVS